ncbi:threonine synthase [Sulfoacidibacillus thermotolerans]|uniref:Threonine synthase n=1 Tax=Sulfoacidibacillus thermotolerans TaxID=1765684 RepID=A0A2U3D9E5_SULT2|nr:threonine synthase [Sulfoacidibacillus thermotolerans]PWI57910.1 threonine synthase [Sulfoacidibacillus thermotolerans]
MFSGLSHLACSKCAKTYEARTRRQMCDCGAPLFARYHLDELRGKFKKTTISQRPQNLWRYHELLPVTNERAIISMSEVMTPLIALPKTAQALDLPNLWVKDESVLPTGTFKARGASVGISRAHELGITEIALPTNGNAGAAWAAYAARSGLKSVIALPKTAPRIPYLECCYAGAKVEVVEGTIAQAGILIAEYVKRTNAYEVSTFKEPYRLEGKKTIGFEIAEQFNWSVPDVIVYPTGGGAGVVGIYKAFIELQALGFIEQRLPRMAIIQATGCAPLVRAFEQGQRESRYFEDAQTIAYGMRVPKALADEIILEIIRETRGIACAVTDEEIRDERARILQVDGFHACPEGAAALAGVRKLRELNFIKDSDRVVSINTGSGLKYMEQVEWAQRIGEKESLTDCQAVRP